MITVHRLGLEPKPFLLNCDLIVMVESTPDTIVTLTTGDRVGVVETPAEVRAEVARWRAGVQRLATAGGGHGDLLAAPEVERRPFDRHPRRVGVEDLEVDRMPPAGRGRQEGRRRHVAEQAGGLAGAVVGDPADACGDDDEDVLVGVEMVLLVSSRGCQSAP